MSEIVYSEAQFNKAVSIVQGLPKDGPIQLNDEQKLDFYKFYKIATVGEVNIPRPGMMDFVGKAKWDAWKAECEKTKTKEKAYTEYVKRLLKLLKEAGTQDAKKYIAEIEAV